jgi:hypothetical protein
MVAQQTTKMAKRQAADVIETNVSAMVGGSPLTMEDISVVARI